MPGCGSGAVVLPWSSPRSQHHAAVAQKIHLSRLFRFPQPALFPLLEGDRLVGRIDMKARRDAGELRVRALWPEPGVAFGTGRRARLEAELDRMARFAGCTGVVFSDGWLRAPVGPA
jgi:hypothetical protein